LVLIEVGGYGEAGAIRPVCAVNRNLAECFGEGIDRSSVSHFAVCLVGDHVGYGADISCYRDHAHRHGFKEH